MGSDFVTCQWCGTSINKGRMCWCCHKNPVRQPTVQHARAAGPPGAGVPPFVLWLVHLGEILGVTRSPERWKSRLLRDQVRAAATPECAALCNWVILAAVAYVIAGLLALIAAITSGLTNAPLYWIAGAFVLGGWIAGGTAGMAWMRGGCAACPGCSQMWAAKLQGTRELGREPGTITYPTKDTVRDNTGRVIGTVEREVQEHVVFVNRESFWRCRFCGHEWVS